MPIHGPRPGLLGRFFRFLLTEGVLQRFTRKLRVFSSYESSLTDVSNGFGAKKLLRSSLPQGPQAQRVLNGVQLLTRYCMIEGPYWRSFVDHYHGLGVTQIHVCAQTEQELDELKAVSVPTGLRLQLHRLPSDQDPGSALQALPFDQLASGGPMTLMVDCDEYFCSLRPDLSFDQLLQAYPGISQWHLPWLMRPCVNPADHLLGGFWGHVGKPLIRSDHLSGVLGDHYFRLRDDLVRAGQLSAPAGLFGFAVVHYWARSFRDCLLKTFYNRFKDPKSSDLSHALTLIQMGDLPVRLRLLAFLAVQSGYLSLPSTISLFVDRVLEERILRRFLSVEDEQLCRSNYDRYCEQLVECKESLPVYPSVSLHHMVGILPAMRL